MANSLLQTGFGFSWHFCYMYLISINRFITNNTTSALTFGGYLNGESPKLNKSSAFYTKEKVKIKDYFRKDQ